MDFCNKNKIPIELHQIDFIDFSQARNLALIYARESSFDFGYILLFDADMELVVGDRESFINIKSDEDLFIEIEATNGNDEHLSVLTETAFYDDDFYLDIYGTSEKKKKVVICRIKAKDSGRYLRVAGRRSWEFKWEGTDWLSILKLDKYFYL